MKNIIFIAPPAAGKGTQSDLLVKKYGYIHISTGDLLREEVSKGTELGNKLKEQMQNGTLISTQIVTDLLKGKLESVNKPFILDGYPRNEEQIYYLNKMLEKINKKIDVVFYLDVPEDLLIKRATGRLTCPSCGRSYHKYFLKPKKENICDDCNIALTSRTDDNEETFKVRLNNYMVNTKPILDYYLGEGVLVSINETDTDKVFAKIEKEIN